ncbi:MAG: M28 family metallopeptidase [Sphingomonadaceae bacterium]
MIRKILISGAISAGVLTLAGCTSGQPAAEMNIPDVAAGDLNQQTMVDAVRELSSDAFEGRAPGTAGEEKTVAYLIDQFQKAGLQPGNNGSWVQDAPMVEITGSNFSPLKISGGKDGDLSLAFKSDWVGASYREAPKTDIQNSELVFVGFGINAPERNWNDYAGIDMKGKTAVILINDPDYETEGLEGPFGGRAMTYYGRWTYKFEEAARQGATAAIIVHDTFPAAYGWNVVDSSWTGPQVYPQSADGGADQTAMNGWIQKSAAEKIMAAAGQDLATLGAAAKKQGFKPVPLGLTMSESFDNATRKFQSQNVIGILPGSERPDEYVLYTAHWDHLGRCQPDATGDDICNGAVDNATGTAALIALAEAQAKTGPALRSMVFLAVTAEESGLLGSTYYAANPVYPLDQTVGGVNMDALSMAGPAKDVTVVGGGKSELDQFLSKALTSVNRSATPESTPEKGFYYRSDHFPFAKQGVPMLYIDGGEDLVNGGREAGQAFNRNFTENHYHQPSDEFNESWDWTGVMQDLQLYYQLGRMMAMSDSWPNWVDGDEFRAARDESCAASDKGC